MSVEAQEIGAVPVRRRRLRWGQWGLRWIAVGYLGIAIILPLSAILKSGLSGGLEAFWR